MFFFIFFLIINFDFNLESKDYCEVKNIFYIKGEINCYDNQLLFGYMKFTSNSNKFEYEYNKELKLENIKKYNKKITEYIKDFCYMDKNLKVKEITNYNKYKFNYETRIIITCQYKKNE
tara:strand:- start:187 stop:543 length:357 start_codon:yes stop_codon:yes gene_type:complete